MTPYKKERRRATRKKLTDDVGFSAGSPLFHCSNGVEGDTDDDQGSDEELFGAAANEGELEEAEVKRLREMGFIDTFPPH